METFWKLTRAMAAVFLAAFAVDILISLLALRNGNLSLTYATIGASYFLVVLPLIVAFIYSYRAENEVREIKTKTDNEMKKLEELKARLDALSGKIDPTISAMNEIQTELEKLGQPKGKKDEVSK